MKLILLMGILCSGGAFVRFGLSRFNTSFPYGTLLANCLGCFFIGYLYSHTQGTDLYLILATGFCGGLTTYSTLNSEWINLRNSLNMFFLYGLLTYLLGFGFLCLGTVS